MVDLARTDKIRQFSQQHPNAIVVPVHAEEASGENQIPRALADYIAAIGGLQVDGAIVQINHVGRAGSGAWYRPAVTPGVWWRGGFWRGIPAGG